MHRLNLPYTKLFGDTLFVQDIRPLMGVNWIEEKDKKGWMFYFVNEGNVANDEDSTGGVELTIHEFDVFARLLYESFINVNEDKKFLAMLKKEKILSSVFLQQLINTNLVTLKDHKIFLSKPKETILGKQDNIYFGSNKVSQEEFIKWLQKIGPVMLTNDIDTFRKLKK